MAAKVRYAGCSRRIPTYRSMAGLGRPRRRPTLLDFNGLCNRKGIFQFNAEIPDGAVHFGVPK